MPRNNNRKLAKHFGNKPVSYTEAARAANIEARRHSGMLPIIIRSGNGYHWRLRPREQAQERN